jgi:ATP-binding cassette subfamily B protein
LLALGRTIVARPRVVILDEATSNLDLAAERRVEAALAVLLEGRTAILIAHRLTTAERADRVVVVDDGGIVEQGTHAQLVAAGGAYAVLHRAWTAGSTKGSAAVPA